MKAFGRAIVRVVSRVHCTVESCKWVIVSICTLQKTQKKKKKMPTLYLQSHGIHKSMRTIFPFFFFHDRPKIFHSQQTCVSWDPKRNSLVVPQTWFTFFKFEVYTRMCFHWTRFISWNNWIFLMFHYPAKWKCMEWKRSEEEKNMKRSFTIKSRKLTSASTKDHLRFFLIKL